MGTCGQNPNVIENNRNININIINSFRKEALKKHNEYRVKHKVPDLKLNENLNEMAQKYANHLLDSQSKINFPFNIYNNDSNLGENIMISTKKTAEEMCEIWYNESKNYDFNINKFQKGTGHFTQLIWKETKEVGFGFKIDGDNFCGVAYYDPAGNVLGEFTKNVCACK